MYHVLPDQVADAVIHETPQGIHNIENVCVFMQTELQVTIELKMVNMTCSKQSWPHISHPTNTTYYGKSRVFIHLKSHFYNVPEGRVAKHFTLTGRWNGGLRPTDEYADIGDCLHIYNNSHVWS